MVQRQNTRRWRGIAAGIAAALTLTFVFTYAPARTFASQALGIFRVRKFQAVQVNPSSMDATRAADVLQRLFADNAGAIKAVGKGQSVASVDDASAAAGYTVRVPKSLPGSATGAPSIRVSESASIELNVKLSQWQALFDAAGRSDIKLPESIDNTTIRFDIPKITSVDWPTDGSAPITLLQAPSPDIQVPEGIDLREIGSVAFQLSGMSPQKAEELAARIDWANTLVVPVPSTLASYKDVTVAGSDGLLIQQTVDPDNSDSSQAAYLLLWEKDGIVYGLFSSGSPDALIQAANSMW
jgi:hypothetical protein